MIKKFLDPRVQKLMQNITGFDLERIFASRPVKKLTAPRYLFLTDEDYEKTIADFKTRANYYLRMPPVMEPADEDKIEVLEKDNKLEGYVDKYGHSNYNLMFVDISPNESYRSRIMVVREPDGTLRRATFKERQRLNSIYFPFKYRTIDMPKMFEQNNLEQVLNKPASSIFVLERACLQFEPDDPNYIRVTTCVYEHILKNRLFNDLRSTRHFGPMAFYYAINKKIDFLIKDQLDRDLIDNVLDTIKLFYLVNNKDISVFDKFNDKDLIKRFIDEECSEKEELKSSLKNLEDKKENIKQQS